MSWNLNFEGCGLPNYRFFSVAEANVGTAERLDVLNNRPFKKMEGSCSSLFGHLDRQGQRVAPFCHVSLMPSSFGRHRFDRKRQAMSSHLHLP
jgi:hypothetical protein